MDSSSKLAIGVALAGGMLTLISQWVPPTHEGPVPVNTRRAPGRLNYDMNGMILGDSGEPARKLVVGIGDSHQRVSQRNPYLKSVQTSSKYPIQLPLLTTLDVTYDDGDLTLPLGCVTTSNVDGNQRFFGVASVGFKLCDEHINDWMAATRQAMQIIAQFKQLNPHAKDMGAWLRSPQANEAQWNQWSGYKWPFIESRGAVRYRYMAYTEQEMNEAFAQGAQDHCRRKPESRRKPWDLDRPMGIFMSERAFATINVAKSAKYGFTCRLPKDYAPRDGTSFIPTPEQQKGADETWRYQVYVSFRFRDDRYPPQEAVGGSTAGRVLPVTETKKAAP